MAAGKAFIDDYLLYLLARASHQASRQFHQVIKAQGVPVPSPAPCARMVSIRQRRSRSLPMAHFPRSDRGSAIWVTCRRWSRRFGEQGRF